MINKKTLTVICVSMVMLTSCGGGDDNHQLNGVALAEVEASLVQRQSKQRADEAALANAIAAGAPTATIAQLQSIVAADKANQNSLVTLAIPDSPAVLMAKLEVKAMDAALQAKQKSDQAALENATAMGASPSTIALLKSAVVADGFSQSAVIAEAQMIELAEVKSVPLTPNQLSFVLTGNPQRPNGGILDRFPTLDLPTLNLTFYGATPYTPPYLVAVDGIPLYPTSFISQLQIGQPSSPILGPFALPSSP